MKNKILILQESAASSRGFGKKIFDHLAERWDAEPMTHELDFSEMDSGIKFWLWRAARWVPTAANLKGAAQSRLLADEEAAVLSKLRQIQPPMVIATSPRAALVMAAIKNRRFYLGRLALALPEFSYGAFAAEPIDTFICLNRLQADSLRAAGIPEDRILEAAALTLPPKAKVTDSAMRELGLLSTMPAVMFCSAGTPAGIESYRRLLRSSISFQVILHAPAQAAASFKAISAPAMHPIKLIAEGQAPEYMKFASAALADNPSYEVMEQAALNRKPIIAVDGAEGVQEFARLSTEGLIALARVPAETQMFAEAAILKKRVSDTEKMFQCLGNQHVKTALAEGLGELLPDKSPKISNYQEKQR
jgi:hypothetical protein